MRAAGFLVFILGSQNRKLAVGYEPKMNNQEQGWYTWWSYMFNARKKNIGWRIDYFCVSRPFLQNVKDASIHADVMGSDHCPVSVTLKKRL